MGDDESATRDRPRRSNDGRSDVYVVLVTSGRDRGTRVPLDTSTPGAILVGQGPACQLRLTDPLVSRRHLSLDLEDGRVRLVDLSSTNGTLVEGLLVRDILLRGGERIVIGDTEIRVQPLPVAVRPVPEVTHFGRVIGASAAMRRLYPLCSRIAAANAPVIIEGETGTGKELLAECLHETGPRSAGPFVVFDPSTVPDSLIDVVLFGSEAGPGLPPAQEGLFEAAHRGTLFIDEVADLDARVQPKLLRAIERSEIQRVGATRYTPVDVRVIAATRRDLDAAVGRGTFRDDLFFRLAVTRLRLPPLRERAGDVAILAAHFWQTEGGRGAAPADLLKKYEGHAWPGNVREVKAAIVRHLTINEIDPAAPPLVAEAPAPSAASIVEDALARDLPLSRAREVVVEEFERLYVERVLARHGGHVTRAAAASGIALRYFQRLRARYGVKS